MSRLSSTVSEPGLTDASGRGVGSGSDCALLGGRRFGPPDLAVRVFHVMLDALLSSASALVWSMFSSAFVRALEVRTPARDGMPEPAGGWCERLLWVCRAFGRGDRRRARSANRPCHPHRSDDSSRRPPRSKGGPLKGGSCVADRRAMAPWRPGGVGAMPTWGKPRAGHVEGGAGRDRPAPRDGDRARRGLAPARGKARWD